MSLYVSQRIDEARAALEAAERFICWSTTPDKDGMPIDQVVDGIKALHYDLKAIALQIDAFSSIVANR